VIRALALLPKDVNYVIAGPVQDNDEYLGKLKSLIKELGLEKRVYFIGVVKGVDKYYLIKKAQMMVHMALWESYCNVVHEGLSQGKVCIVADNTALPLLIKNDVNGYCVETTDHEELAKKINYVLENKQTKKIIEMEKRIPKSDTRCSILSRKKNFRSTLGHFNWLTIPSQRIRKQRKRPMKL
jgi:glycosyltransferase involved in cell wall biosynthesis